MRVRSNEMTAKLPEWDLSDLYAGPDAPEIERDLETAAAEARAFENRYQGRLATLDGAGLAEAIAAYEAIQERLGRLTSFADLLQAGNVIDPDIACFQQNIEERVNAITLHLLFFTLEVNRIDDATLDRWLGESEALARYRPWLDQVRRFRPHQLADDMERLLHEKEVAGRAAWVRLFDETMAALTFEVTDPQTGDTRTLGVEETLHLLSDRDGARRKAAADALTRTLRENIRLFALVTNTLAKDKEIEDRWRSYASPEDARHLANNVEPEVVEALRSAVVEAYPRLSHRYYALKASWMGQERLEFWDRNAPLPEDADEEIPWDRARDMVLSAYRAFSPRLADMGVKFFENAWIDAPVRKGKAPGAFAHSTVPSAHPYLFLNYLGKTRDVMTLAHELGHGVHQLLAAPQGLLLAHTPLTLAETASVFGEMLTFRALLADTKDPVRKRVLLASKVEDMLNTVVRQIAFYEFERRIHAERRQGEIKAGRIGEIWLDVQHQSLGPAINLGDGYEVYWSYIPHFIHSPFYVYAYAFGDCLVNALYATYQEEPDGFEDKYLALLQAGGSLGHKDLLAPFGLDASDPGFWQRGLGVMSGLIDELETLTP
ncbi:MAG: M3 family oligoendopeptidase [Alphaproteobacteria bacterium]|nr:MAG: M3 family oligoendopeptidase [Alphaproteobacteria bacterium]